MQEVQKEKVIPYTCKPRAPRSVPTELGSKYMIRAKLYIDKDGNQIAEPGEKIDLNAYVQASKASTDMATIVARAKAGDETVLNVTPNGFYGDTSIIPSSVNDFEKINKLGDIASEKFNALPEEVKSLFSSSEDFLNAVLSNKVDSIIKSASSKQAPKAEAKEGE